MEIEIPKPKATEWATYCPDRSPKFKIHTSAGLAHSAVSDKKPNRDVALLHFEDGEWQTVYEYTRPDKCSRCGGGMIMERWGRRLWEGHIADDDDSRQLRKWQRDVVCAPCHEFEIAARRIANQDKRDRTEYERLQAKYDHGKVGVAGCRRSYCPDHG